MQGELFKLVKSLNGPEKTYFRKMAKRHSPGNQAHHLHLFSLISAAPVHDDDRFRRELGLNTLAHYSVVKKYLFGEILKSVAFMKQDSRKPVHSDFILRQIHFLLEKGLYMSAGKMISAEMKIAEKNQWLGRKLQLLKAEYLLVRNQFRPGGNLKLLTLNQKIRTATEQYFLVETLWYIFRELLLLRDISNNRTTEKEMKEADGQLTELRRLRNTAQAVPLQQILFNTDLALGAYLSRKRNTCSAACKLLVQLWQNHAPLAKIYPQLFREGAQIIFYNSLESDKTWQTDKLVRNLHKISETIPTAEEQIRWKILEFNTRLKICHKSGQYEKVKSLIAEKSGEILEWSARFLTIHEFQIILTSVAISYFVLEMYNRADELLYRLKELARVSGKEDVFYFALVFHLLVLFEMKDWYRLANGLEAAYRQVYVRKGPRPFEKELMVYIRDLAKVRTRKKELPILQTMLQKLDVYKDDAIKKMYFSYFNYYGWLQSRLEGIPYREFVRRQASNQ